MALSATICRFHFELSDVDRGVYESVELRAAQHPSESDAYFVTRVLAWALEYNEGLAFGRGVSTPEDPAIYLADDIGDYLLWIEIGQPSAERLHKVTDPTAPEGSRKADFINTWWEGAQLKLELYLAIAETGSAASWSKKAAEWGHSFGVRINAQYEGMDGEQRVETVARLVDQLKAAK